MIRLSREIALPRRKCNLMGPALLLGGGQSSVAAQYFRLNVTANNGGSNLRLGEFILRTEYDGPTIFTGGVASASNYLAGIPGYPPSNAFAGGEIYDKTGFPGIYWQTQSNVTAATLTYQLPSAVDISILKEMVLFNDISGGGSSAPRDFSLQYSTDGANWITLKSWSNQLQMQNIRAHAFSLENGPASAWEESFSLVNNVGFCGYYKDRGRVYYAPSNTVGTVLKIIRGNKSRSSADGGVYVFEVIVESATRATSQVTSCSVGIGGTDMDPTIQARVGDASDSYGLYSTSTRDSGAAASKRNNGVSSTYGKAWGYTGDVVGIVWRTASGAVEYFINGLSQGVAFTGVTGTKKWPALTVLTETGGPYGRYRLNSAGPFSYAYDASQAAWASA